MNPRDLLGRIRPTPEEEQALAEDVAALLAAARDAMAAHGLDGEPSIQGSIAKGTWLRGSADIDLFLLLDPGLPQERLEEAAEQVGQRLLDAPRKKYAQHPYVMGQHRGRMVDLVPAYAVPEATARMSAVDRTPFHTTWVRGQLDAAARDEVRLVKQWMKGTDVYGAHTALGGFSGYLVEVLVAALGDFDGVVGWLGRDARPRRIVVADDDIEDEVSPLVVPDPVDPARNCAAAVRHDTLARAVEAARAWRRAPDEAFLFPRPPRAEPRAALAQALTKQDAAWIGLQATPRTDRLDIVMPQFQKAGRLLAQGLAEAGFPVLRSDVASYDDDRRVGFQWVVKDHRLPATRLHAGPPAGGGQAASFRDKWQGHPDALGPVTEGPDGHLRVPVAVRERTPQAWISAHGLNHLRGRHVEEALDPRPPLLSRPHEADAGWAPRVADLVLDRRPWER